MSREEAFELLCRLAQGIAGMFGDNCETLVHEMEGNRIKNVVIFNGHVSGRSAGSTLSIYGKDTMEDDADGTNLDQDFLNQMVVTPSGKNIKSSTFHVRGADFHYALGINYDVTVMGQMRHVLENFTEAAGSLMISISEERSDLESIFNACLEVFSKPPARMRKADRLALVALLKEKGAFHLQRSVPYVAERMGVSKYTIYNYLNELEQT